jgi:hypothetical protein
MKKWQYKIVDSREVKHQGFFGGARSDEVEEFLNRLGAEGWEIVNLDFYEMEGRCSFTGLAKRDVEN